ncbi:MAG: sulfur carrier protein ThiS [Dehalococcoidia bacterium]|jgi:thiamine biosynthesis protein ThiS|uniref:Thiamine biosynthesis protein ThiS n=1 Tax=marine metagenome TaxID=408172 RepID=A0A381SZ64_9ZZZZ|nr:thiamine biosynthesis protein ThiS [Dehalococcoidia bacterium]MCH2312510.1 sulfur carrier protein ThiS [SAR202 cluster bacterium]MEC7912685.1 sulfur carrier protein ThiS [Chloroflexota bacterium]MBV46914.1 thiamine biosynthesis protein ThiS [Dehalococcoidia bacterium]MCS5650217.1 sulfur carrier protein ThiS [Dehalococcoidia bacterium]|tara:strand:- start:2690 stop:2896 length:207 start_codon:yes stop_codon:yes gene_type:complete
MNINLNGKASEIKSGSSLMSLIDELGLTGRKAIAIALNGEVLTRERYKEIILNEGDSLEVVRAIGGGS